MVRLETIEPIPVEHDTSPRTRRYPVGIRLRRRGKREGWVSVPLFLGGRQVGHVLVRRGGLVQLAVEHLGARLVDVRSEVADGPEASDV